MVDLCPFEGTVIDQRFEVGERLGQGSLGRVFECRDRKQGGRRLALKVIRPDIMDKVAADLLKHEFRVLAHLDHPNVVKVFEFGRIPGREELYFTEELLEGFHFVKVLRRAPLSVFLDVFTQVVRGLGYVHAKGVLHSDIKPKNVLITSRWDGSLRARLIDFHLCRQGTIFRDQLIRGTISYMAPEMIRGDPIDFRADLYGVGVMAYEALARRRPFTRKTPVKVLRAHIEDQPKALMEIRKDLPKSLCALIDRLLLKDPSQRPASGREILQILRDQVDPDIDIETQQTRRAYLRSAILVSRESSLERIRRQVEIIGETPNVTDCLGPTEAVKSQEELWRCFGDLDAGQRLSSFDSINNAGGLPEWRGSKEKFNGSPVLVIGGEGGIGKSRLLAEARIECQLAGVAFFRARAGRVGSRPLGPFLVLLRALIERLNLMTLLKQVAPEGCLDPAKIVARHRRRGREGGMIEALLSMFEELSEILPFVAAIDDFEEADEASIELAHRLSRGGPRALYLLACCDSNSKLRWTELSCIRLTRLGEGAVQQLLSSMLGEQVQSGFAARVYTVTGGNPRFTEETLRHLAEQGALTTEQGFLSAEMGALFHVKAPKSVEQVLRQRISRLSQAELKVLGVLSLSLRSRPADFVSAVSKIARHDVSNFLDAFGEHGWVHCHTDLLGRALYWIDQSPLRHQLVAKLGVELFESLQGRIARLLEARHPAAESFWTLSGDPDWVHDRAEELAYHFALSGDPDSAFKHSLAAAEVTRTHIQQGRVRRLYKLTVELSEGYEEGHKSGRRMAQFRLAEACAYLGRYEEALSRFERLRLDRQSSSWERASRLYHCARLRLKVGEFGEALEEIGLGLALVEEAFDGSEKLKARLLALQGSCLLWLGRAQQARQRAMDATRSLEAQGLTSENAAAQHIAALSGLVMGQNTSAITSPQIRRSWIESLCVPEVNTQDVSAVSRLQEQQRLDRILVEAIALNLASENREEAALALNIRGNIKRASGHYQQAFEDYERAVMLCEELENIPGTSLARMNVGHLLIEVGDFENGDASLCLALDGAKYCELDWLQGFIHISLARAARWNGDQNQWRSYLSEAKQNFDRSDFKIGPFELALEHLEACLQRNERLKAQALVTKLTTEQANIPTPDQRLRLLLLSSFLDCADPDRACQQQLRARLAELNDLSGTLWTELTIQTDRIRALLLERMKETTAACAAMAHAREAVESLGQHLSHALKRCYLEDPRRLQIFNAVERLESLNKGKEKSGKAQKGEL
jgi:serine/threonine protein kinase/tetratricopeptide (TPR) repeat protein